MLKRDPIIEEAAGDEEEEEEENRLKMSDIPSSYPPTPRLHATGIQEHSTRQEELDYTILYFLLLPSPPPPPPPAPSLLRFMLLRFKNTARAKTT
jgi:hypothetical protein